jgi:hypothetical protein
VGLSRRVGAVVNARVAGVRAAVLAVAVRAPLGLVPVVAAALTAAVRVLRG